ncbi:UNVERIFIED_CONTAM: hypothetical protein FKN15_050620 [Acipenser sinensis]
MEVFNEAVEYLLGYGIPVVEDDQLDLEDVFDGECDNGFLSAVDSPFSPVRTESADFGDGLSEGDPEKMLERRALVLKSILSSEQQYLSELEAMLMNMMSSKDGSNCRTKYTLEALLYKPLDRVTKTTLVLHDLLKHTPEDHPDRPLLQEALRISSSFLSGVNEEVPHKKSAVTISKGTIRQLVKDGFLVDLSDGTRSLRHVFLFTDLILCAKLKAGRQPQYRFVWYLPLPGLSLIPGPECQLPPDTQCRMDQMKQKAFRLRQEIQLQRSHTVLLSSLYELSEWRDNVERLRGENSSDLGLCGTLCVVIHRATQLQQPEIDLSIFLEVDSFGYFENKAQTRVLVGDLTPSWEEEFSLQVDGAHDLRLLCVQQPGRGDSWTEDRVLGKTTVQLDAKTLLNKWKRSVVSLHQEGRRAGAPHRALLCRGGGEEGAGGGGDLSDIRGGNGGSGPEDSLQYQ